MNKKITHLNFNDTINNFRNEWIKEINTKKQLEIKNQVELYNEYININWNIAPYDILVLIKKYFDIINTIKSKQLYLNIKNLDLYNYKKNKKMFK